MTAALNIAPELHETLSGSVESVSSAVRALLRHAGETPEALPAAFAARALFKAETSGVKRYAVYLNQEEKAIAKELSDRYLLSLSQIVQVLLEDMLFRAGVWPPAGVDSPAGMD